MSDSPSPAMVYVVLDEHPDSINDGYYLLDPHPGSGNWGDLPASCHNGAGGFSFADGHSEIHKCRYPSTIQKVTFSGFNSGYPLRERADNDWAVERTSILFRQR